ncbi:MAG: hypothetical protein GF387_02510 [Candidatus Portnoybacteria bacterium]|nr:hypothetical protein [Candidatus Portnoybacteria bacterium]
MTNPKIQEYIEQCKKQGLEDQKIREALINAGWPEKDVDEALNPQASKQPEVPSPEAINPQQQMEHKSLAKLPSAGELLKEAFKIYKRRFLTLFAISFLALIIPIILTFIGTIHIEGTVGAIAFLLLALIVSLFILWSILGLIYAIKEESLNIGKAYKNTLSKIHSALWVSILSFLITFFGYILFLIPGLIFSIWFSFGLFILISENTKGLKALLKSKKYIKGYWWAVFGRQIFISLILMIVAIPIMFILQIAGSSQSLTGVVEGVLVLFYFPLLFTYNFLVYKKIKEIKGQLPEIKKGKPLFIIFAILGLIALMSIPIILTSFILSLLKKASTGM